MNVSNRKSGITLCLSLLVTAGSAQAAPYAADSFKAGTQQDPGNTARFIGDPAKGEYNASNTTSGTSLVNIAGQGPTLTGFTGNWTSQLQGSAGGTISATSQFNANTGSLTHGSLPPGFTQPGRVIAIGSSAGATVRSAFRSLAGPLPGGGTVYMSGILNGSASTTATVGEWGVGGFVSTISPYDIVSGSNMKGVMFGYGGDATNTAPRSDAIVRVVDYDDNGQLTVTQRTLVNNVTAIDRLFIMKIEYNVVPNTGDGTDRITYMVDGNSAPLANLSSEQAAFETAGGGTLGSGTAGPGAGSFIAEVGDSPTELTQLRFASKSQIANIFYDEFRIGPTFADVVPEPSAAALGLVAVAGLLTRRGRGSRHPG